MEMAPAGQPQADLALQKGTARSCWREGRRGLSLLRFMACWNSLAHKSLLP